MNEHVEIDHLTKYAFRVNSDQVYMNLEICLKIHANVSNFETASPETTEFCDNCKSRHVPIN